MILERQLLTLLKKKKMQMHYIELPPFNHPLLPLDLSKIVAEKNDSRKMPRHIEILALIDPFLPSDLSKMVAAYDSRSCYRCEKDLSQEDELFLTQFEKPMETGTCHNCIYAVALNYRKITPVSLYESAIDDPVVNDPTYLLFDFIYTLLFRHSFCCKACKRPVFFVTDWKSPFCGVCHDAHLINISNNS